MNVFRLSVLYRSSVWNKFKYICACININLNLTLLLQNIITYNINKERNITTQTVSNKKPSKIVHIHLFICNIRFYATYYIYNYD